ncbi:prolyl oligopeptidase family serine peptidase [Flavobacterium humidisoli]|uniref:Prolyl oligopeptidase family serine peptidase n=1 Tax=Flavobacterium humidisoli TaxID=2937442 RepID=A0ABY4LYP0_9FLAO|nr:prolyl oligopeptidase family serine peptidase [Flavobacterium humidisoli]UPZ17932.1 prolyl oligopeptidase family serine peptidase [Flavobacterium humidisoli]
MLFRISFLISILAAACPLWGQAPQKSTLTEENFRLWHKLNLTGVSQDGNWLSYVKKYDGLPDTLFINKIKSSLTYNFPEGKSGRFTKGFFSCIMPDSTLKILDLNSNKSFSIRRCISYDLGSEDTRIITVMDSKKLKNIVITDNRGRILDSIYNVTEHVISDNRRYIAFVEKNGLRFSMKYYNLSTAKSQDVFESEKEIVNIIWGKTDRYLAFFSGSKTQPGTVHLIELCSGIHNSYTFKEEDSIKIFMNRKLKISHAGNRVFFDTYSLPLNTAEDQSVEIWHTNDKLIYPVKKAEESYKNYFFSVWHPEKGTFKRYGRAKETAKLSGGENYAVFFKEGLDGQEGNRYHINSIFIESLETGKRNLAVKGIMIERSRLSISPSDDKMVYYYNDAWWCYDMRSEKHISLTASIEGHWDDKIESKTQPDIYAAPVWTADGHSVLLQDKNDLWLVNLDGTSAKRITNGKERNIEFYIDRFWLNRNRVFHPYTSLQDTPVALNENLFLSASGNNKEKGYFILQNGKMPQKLFYGDFDAGQLHHTERGRYFAKVQSFDLPPSICWTDGLDKQMHTAVKSNPQHSSYRWGRSELITYRVPDGRFLKAAVLYPAGYDHSKKYPMIIKIYQSLSYQKHEYMIPSVNEETGFNPVNYTLDGYLVLLPDIGYVYGRTGISAAESVEAAVNKIKQMGIVDERRIGLIGHSFGGYEVNFIMTRSSSFAAGVSGAGVSDLTGRYFSTDNVYKGSQAWRFEGQQWRMRNSFYDAKESYYENSPIFHAETINTPLLIWCGKDDATVPASQSVALYYAMRRLKKNAVLLQYKDEDHNLTRKEAQRDLCLRVKHWFDHYLKGTKPERWIKENM